MNILLIFFAIPIATIILSAILETFIRCPFKVAGIFFSIFLVLAFILGGTAELIVAAIIYTILSFITAYIVEVILRNREENNCGCNNNDNNCGCNNNNNNNCGSSGSNNGCGCGRNNSISTTFLVKSQTKEASLVRR